MADASLVVDQVEFVVEEGKLHEFARAVGDSNDGGVPLTFTAVAGHWRDQAAMVEKLGLDIRRVVVGGSEWEYHRPLRVGDRLSGARTLIATEEKRGMKLFTLESRFVRVADGEVAVIQRDTVIELPS